jgi:hypothetical protein
MSVVAEKKRGENRNLPLIRNHPVAAAQRT